MNKQKMVILMAGVLLWCGGMVNATLVDLDIYSDTTIESGDYGTINIYDTPPDQTIVTMKGGSSESIWSYNSSIFQMQNGNVSWVISAHNESSVVMSGGSTKFLELFNTSVAHISGGEIMAYFGIWDSATVHIYGKNFTVTPAAISNHWIIEGLWADNTPFSIYFRPHTSAWYPPPGVAGSNVHLHIIPEPATLGLFGVGILIARRAAKTFRK